MGSRATPGHGTLLQVQREPCDAGDEPRGPGDAVREDHGAARPKASAAKASAISGPRGHGPSRWKQLAEGNRRSPRPKFEAPAGGEKVEIGGKEHENNKKETIKTHRNVGISRPFQRMEALSEQRRGRADSRATWRPSRGRSACIRARPVEQPPWHPSRSQNLAPRGVSGLLSELLAQPPMHFAKGKSAWASRTGA